MLATEVKLYFTSKGRLFDLHVAGGMRVAMYTVSNLMKLEVVNDYGIV
jgi:hypothetical protein